MSCSYLCSQGNWTKSTNTTTFSSTATDSAFKNAWAAPSKKTDTTIIKTRANARGPCSRSLNYNLCWLLLYDNSCVGVIAAVKPRLWHRLLLHGGWLHVLLHWWLYHARLGIGGRLLLTRLGYTTLFFSKTRVCHTVVHLEIAVLLSVAIFLFQE